MPEARAAYQKALSMSQQEPEKGFFKKIGRAVEFRGC
jgi:predicted RNA polymerase sigma factor